MNTTTRFDYVVADLTTYVKRGDLKKGVEVVYGKPPSKLDMEHARKTGCKVIPQVYAFRETMRDENGNRTWIVFQANLDLKVLFWALRMTEEAAKRLLRSHRLPNGRVQLENTGRAEKVHNLLLRGDLLY